MDLDEWQKKEFAGLNPGLARVKKFVAAVGHPEKRFPAVHVAGTNGKGSTSRIIAALLNGAGYSTGLYTSPHLTSIGERIQIDGIPVSRKRLNGLVRRYGPLARRLSLSFFEFFTGLAFVEFAEKKVDIAVVECGLGGKYDATNVIPAPLAAVITEIDYDHMDYLGGTLTAIAGEKAGIIKQGTVVLCGARRPAARKTIISVARRRRAEVYLSGRDFQSEKYALCHDGSGHKALYNGIKFTFPYAVPLAGRHQADNTALALAAVETLIDKGFRITPADMQRSLRGVEWQARFSVLKRKDSGNVIIVDGAHNPSGMRALVETLSQGVWRGKKMTFITGILKDKAFGRMAAICAGRAARIIAVSVESERTLEAGQLAAAVKKHHPGAAVETAPGLDDALRMTNNNPVTVICGSLYLAGEFYRDSKKTFTIEE